MERKKYNTKQKQIIERLIKEYNHKFTIKDLYYELKGKVGLTTIYRLIDELFLEGLLNKSIGSSNEMYYEYLASCPNENHFYLKCNKCGKLIHIDCNCINHLSKHVLKEHNFQPIINNIMINGLCNKCIK